MMTTEQRVFNYLDRLESDSCPVPTIRTIHDHLGCGSLTTICNAVKKWKSMHMDALDEASELPKRLPDEFSRELQSAVWKVFRPLLKERLVAQKSVYEEKIQTLQEELAACREELAQLRMSCQKQREEKP